MSFLAWTPAQARKPFAEVLPDGRKRLTRYFKVGQTSSNVPPELDYPVGTHDPWPEADTPTGWTGLYLTYKQMRESERGFPGGPEDSKPICQIIFEQIALSGETTVGAPDQSELTDGRVQIIKTAVQFSTVAFVPETINVTTATGSQGTVCYLFLEETEDDGTLRNIKRTYQSAGTVATDDESLQGGALLLKKITSFHTVPSTPSGYTSIGTPVQNPNGYPIYTYTFAKGNGEVGRRYVDAQGGTTAFNLTTPSSSVGALRCIITYLTASSVTADPTTGPASFVRIGVEFEDKDGYREWNVSYGYGTGLVLDTLSYVPFSSSPVLVIYHRIAFGTAPTTPSATIGGTVKLIDTEQRNADGYIIYDYQWAEGNGQANITTQGEPDGALVYTVSEYKATAGTPSYPGTGSNSLISLTQRAEKGYFLNTAVYKKWPASVGFRKMAKFLMPGLAAISGSPILYSQSPPVTMEILATVTVDYGTSQITTTPFTVSAYAKLNVQWIPYTNPGVSPTPGSPPADTTTGPPQGYSEALGGYLAGASGTTATNQYFNGVFVSTYTYTLSSSTPSSQPSGATTIAVENDPYLVDTSGTVVYRRMVTTYTF